MKPAFFRHLFSGLALLLVSGCVLSEQPLSAVKDARPDPGLTGTWRAVDAKHEGVGRVSFGQDGLGKLSVQGRNGTGKQVTESYSFFVTRTAKGSYINLMFPRSAKQSEKRVYYGFYKYTLSEDRQRLRLWSVKGGVFEDGVKEGKLKGRTVKMDPADTIDTLLLQNSSAAILRFLEARPAAEIFADPNNYRKVN